MKSTEQMKRSRHPRLTAQHPNVDSPLRSSVRDTPIRHNYSEPPNPCSPNAGRPTSIGPNIHASEAREPHSKMVNYIYIPGRRRPIYDARATSESGRAGAFLVLGSRGGASPKGPRAQGRACAASFVLACSRARILFYGSRRVAVGPHRGHRARQQRPRIERRRSQASGGRAVN